MRNGALLFRVVVVETTRRKSAPTRARVSLIEYYDNYWTRTHKSFRVFAPTGWPPAPALHGPLPVVYEGTCVELSLLTKIKFAARAPEVADSKLESFVCVCVCDLCARVT